VVRHDDAPTENAALDGMFDAHGFEYESAVQRFLRPKRTMYYPHGFRL
jgi:hypothetical protein